MEENIRIRPTIKKLEVNEKAVFPLEKLNCVRSNAGEIALIFDRKYTTKTDKEARTITITRVS